MLTNSIETTRNPCDPSPCGVNANCKKHPSKEHASTCVCMKGYLGNPFLACHPECTENTHCTSNRVCRNQKCVNPCLGFCGINAICSILNHVPSCDCPQGYERHPTWMTSRYILSCKISKIFLLLFVIWSKSWRSFLLNCVFKVNTLYFRKCFRPYDFSKHISLIMDI